MTPLVDTTNVSVWILKPYPIIVNEILGTSNLFDPVRLSVTFLYAVAHIVTTGTPYVTPLTDTISQAWI